MKTASKYRLLGGHYLVGLLLLALVLPLPSFAQSQQRQNGTAQGQVTLDFRAVELTDLIKTISELTGKNFLYDEKVRGKVTIVSPDSMTLEEAYQLFLSVLYVKGYTIVPSGKVNKIVPIKGARSESLPTIVDGYRHNTEQFITRLVRLEYLDAATIASTVLQPLVAATGHLLAYPPTNTLIITDSGANIERLLRIIRELDLPGSANLLEVIPLQNSDAEEIAKICTEVIAQPTTTNRVRKKNTPASHKEVSKIIPYTRTNSLIIMANADDMKMIKGLILIMDKESESKRSNINLYYLENADAETLAATLNEILTGIKTQTQAVGKKRNNKGPLSSGPVTITADKPTNSLIINASHEDYITLQGIIEQLDIKRKQVYVEVLILELSMDATKELGTSLSGAVEVGNDGVIAFNTNRQAGVSDALVGGAASLLSTAVDGLLAGGFFNPITITGPDGTETTVPSLSVLIDLSQTDSDINLLSAPRLLTSDNEEAEIIVGANVPVITGRLTDAVGGSGLAQSVSIERQDVALILRFTPQITSGDLVRLNVYQEITDIAPASLALAASVGRPSEVGPTFTKRVLRNTVLVANEKTVVLGGLMATNVIETETKVPFLGDIPFLGWLFKRTSTHEEKTNLLIFINPTIINNSEDLDRVTGRNRKAASGFITDRLRGAVPENFFGGLGGVPQAQEPTVPGRETYGIDSAAKAPNEEADSNQWVTPAPRRNSDQ